MQQLRDPLGNAYSVDAPQHIAAFNRIIGHYLEFKQDSMALLDQLLAEAPHMPMAHCLRAYLLKLASDPRLKQPAKKEQAWLKCHASLLNPREQLHLAALTAWLDDLTQMTIEIFEQLLSLYPKDILALRINHHLHFYSGNATNMQHSMARVGQNWHSHELFFNFVLGMESFGLEEAGHYDLAEAKGRQAAELNLNDQWAIHAVTHVMHMQQRYQEGIQWLDQFTPHWQSCNNFIYHMYWHKALFHLNQGELDAALNLYDDKLSQVLADDFYLDVCNAASLLWRLELSGMNVTGRWEELQAYSPHRIKDDELVFCNLHYLMAPARLQSEAIIQQGIAHLAQWAKTPTSQGQVAGQVGLTLGHALVDFGKGHYQKAAQRLAGTRGQLAMIGGSLVQRQLFDDLCQTALARS